MPKRYFKIELSEEAEVHVFFESIRGLIVGFAVKLIYKTNEKYFEVIRFDNGHNCPHKDILDTKGEVIRKVWFEFLDNKQALDLGIKDLKENCDLYIDRFKRWLKQ